MADEIQPIDINKIAAEVIISATERTISAATGPARNALRRMLQALSDAYRPYLEKTFVRVRTIRTFLKPNEPLDLLAQYVPVSLSNGKRSFSADEVVEMATKEGCVVVSGLAGRGKSVLMKYIALSMYHAPQGKIPLFMELRALNSLTSKEILQYIHAQHKGNSNIHFSDFVEAINKGYFTLLLDGFDEIDPDTRDTIEQQILDFALSYPQMPIVVSGRPDDRFSSWEQFSVLSVCPMTLKQTRQLIQNADYDDDVKKTFLRRLTESFYKQHESFLSTPLLAIMLMLTFEEYAEIPTSLHIFYRNAFDTLVRRHDAMKSQFLRKTHSSCTADEFKKLFASFCLLTYSNSKFQFHHDEIIEFIGLALKQQRLKAEPERVLNDLTESICLLQKEGFEIAFVHRSFQEYFCALFISQAPAGVVAQYLDSGRFRIQDNVLTMLYGMVPERVESEWASPRVSKLLNEFPKGDPTSTMRMARALFDRLDFSIFKNSEIAIALDEGPQYRQVDILRKLYPNFFGEVGRKARKARKEKDVVIWRDGVLHEMETLETAGDPQFRDARKRLTDSTGGVSFHIDLDESAGHLALIHAIGLDEHAKEVLDSLRKVQRHQKTRAKGDDAFLRSVFSRE